MSEPADTTEEIVITSKRLPPLPILEKQTKFFNQLHDPLTALARAHEIDENFLLGLAAYESGWFEHPESVANNNPLGVNRPGKSVLQNYESVDGALNYWGRVFGPRVTGVKTPREFIDRLRTKGIGAYNTDNSEYDVDLGEVIDSIKMKRPQWLQQKSKVR